jgi:membrane fusion protein, multidrug efflux system
MKLLYSIVVCAIVSIACVYALDEGDFNTFFDTEKEVFRVVLEPRDRTVLSSEVTTKVKKISKEMGDHFDTNEILIHLDKTIFQATHKKAMIIHERAEEQFSAKKELFEDNIASSFELKDAQASLAIAEADVKTAKKELDSCDIRAPYEGHLDNLLVNEHEMVQQGQPLVEIVNDKSLLAKLLIPSKYFDALQTGETLYIHVKETQTTVPAIVTHIGAVLDPASSMLKIFAEIDNSKGELRAGMIGTTEIYP